MEEIRKKITDFMENVATGPLTFRELSHAFDVKKAFRNEFKKVVKAMVMQGELVKTRGGTYGLPSRMNLVTGSLVCHPDGYGFVVPEGEGTDVFIGARKMNGAMHGDSVVARVEGGRPGGRREGSILRIVKRARTAVVGRFEWGRGFGVVIPSDERVLDHIIIPPADAKGVQEGQIVSAEITRWPGRTMSAAGRVAEVLGEPDDPDVEAEVILRKYGLTNSFPANVMAEVKSVPLEVVESDLQTGSTCARERSSP